MRQIRKIARVGLKNRTLANYQLGCGQASTFVCITLRGQAMTNKGKIAAATALMAAGIASPAFAQDTDHFGSQPPHYFDSNRVEIFGSWSPQGRASSGHGAARGSGLSAFTRARGRTMSSFRSRVAAGGSTRYNENL